MKNLFYYLGVAVLVAFLGLLVFYDKENTLGSVEQGSEYNVTTLSSSDVGTSSVKSISGTLGTVVVASSSASGSVDFYATSTTATSSADLVFSIPANLDEGTYVFDVGFGGGLIAEVASGFTGNYIVTWR